MASTISSPARNNVWFPCLRTLFNLQVSQNNILASPFSVRHFIEHFTVVEGGSQGDSNADARAGAGAGAVLEPGSQGDLNADARAGSVIDPGSQGDLNANARAGSVLDPDDKVCPEQIEFHKWRKLDSRNLGINRSMITDASWTVLKILQSSGFEAYLVGGCVRDLLLHRIPKDFDVITTAALPQIRRKFHRSIIVGRRFPICIVNVKGSVIEVSSFETVSKQAEIKDKIIVSQMPAKCDEKDMIRWRNCMHRDFTINSLFFDPFVNKIYDYSNALTDLRSLKLRTLVPAHLSFKEDCARILRALRLAARLNLSFAQETDIAIRKLSNSIAKLDKSRIMMELNYMLSYGAAEPSLRLLQRYDLLKILLPFHAAHLTKQFRKQPGQRSSMLMKLFSNLDLLVSCDRPSDSTIWIGLLVFQIALVKDPQDVLVVLTFASLLYHGEWNQGVKYARQHAEAARIYTPEILDSCNILSDDELGRRVTQFAAQVQNSVDHLSGTDSLLEAMAKFPDFPCSGLVFVSPKMGGHVKQLFDPLVQKSGGISSLKTSRNVLRIDYRALSKGDLCETRFVLGRIIVETMVPAVISGGEIIKEGSINLHKIDSQQRVGVVEKKRQTQLNLEKSIVDDIKKGNLIGQSNNISKDTSKRQKVVVNQQQKEMAENKKRIIVNQNRDACLSSDSISKEEVKASQLPHNEIRVILEDVFSQSRQHGMKVKEANLVNSKKYQDCSKNYLNVLKKVNHEAAEKQGTSMQEHVLPLEESIEQKQVVLDNVESNSDHSGVKIEKDEKSNPGKGSPPRLSRLFS